MPKIPFIALKLPYTELIDVKFFIDELTLASEQLAIFNTNISHTKVVKDIILSHLFKLESFYSTKIEGTQTTINEIYEYKQTELNASTAEIIRYVAALQYCSNEIKNNPISSRMIKKIHEILLSDSRRKNTNFQPGEYKISQNYVGEHTPTEPQKVNEYMSNLENYINNMPNHADNLQPLIKAALIHAQFETIHPFPDGNGRVGRILIPLYLYKEKKLNDIHFFMSHTLEQNKYEYYNFLQGTRKNTAEGFSSWVKYFLRALAGQAKQYNEFLEKIDNLYDQCSKILLAKSKSNKPLIILNCIFERVIFSCAEISEITGIPINTVRYNLRLLCDLQIIIPGDKKRNKNYYFYKLLDILKI